MKYLILENDNIIEFRTRKFLYTKFGVDFPNEIREGKFIDKKVHEDVTIIFGANNYNEKELGQLLIHNDVLIFHSTEFQWEQITGLTKMGLDLVQKDCLKIKDIYMIKYNDDDFTDTNIKIELREAVDEIEFNELLQHINFYWVNPSNFEETLIKDI